MTAVGLPAALLLGLLADAVMGITFRVAGRRRRWTAPLTGIWVAFRRTARGRDRPAAAELTGLLVALAGAGLAGAAGLGLAPASMVLVYPALVLAAAGGHVAASAAPTLGGRARAARVRWEALLAEPAFVIGLGAMVLRWRAFDLEAVRGAQAVLGPGAAVGPPAAAAGLLLAAAAVLVAGGLRLPLAVEGRGPRKGRAAHAAAVALCRWGIAGATALVVAVPVAGGVDPVALGASPAALAAYGGAALLAAAGLGAVAGLATLLPAKPLRALLGPAAAVVAAAAVVLVVRG